MPSFTYSAKDLSGESVRGSIDAVNRKVALQKLTAQKLRPLSVNETNESRAGKVGLSGFSSLFRSNSSKPKVKVLNRSVALPFLTGIREMLNCGIQSADALKMMSTRLSDPQQKLLATNLWDELSQGRSLSEAFRKQPKVFHESVVSLVEAGEATGNLKNVLTRIVESMEEQKAIRGKLVAALSYPCFLILVAIGLVLLFLFSLLPRIEGLLASLGGDLPASTKILIATADGLLNYGWIAAIGIALAVALLISWRKSPAGRFKFDALLLRIPGAGRIVRDTQILQFTQTLSLLLENGIIMVQALAMAERSLSNYSMRSTFSEVRTKVVEGVALSTAFKSTWYFEDIALDVFTVGESTGDVVPGLRQMSRQYSEMIDKFVKTLLGFVSTGVLLGVFAMVGMIAFGIISAVFQLSSSLSAG
ncbi:MAG TPA: type II secretion system F family protein [Opitutae bacterium]|nr:type II secretion system F family protein [Opitutae bacterium]|tara:strand:+ start:17504 stop:18760 length:1257 start_codon:yes stop_codon:yes gene_type:complete